MNTSARLATVVALSALMAVGARADWYNSTDDFLSGIKRGIRGPGPSLERDVAYVASWLKSRTGEADGDRLSKDEVIQVCPQFAIPRDLQLDMRFLWNVFRRSDETGDGFLDIRNELKLLEGIIAIFEICMQMPVTMGA